MLRMSVCPVHPPCRLVPGILIGFLCGGDEAFVSGRTVPDHRNLLTRSAI